jgi:hypothetical protein
VTTQTTIPCKRPKITTEPHPGVSGLWNHACAVPGCGWSFISVKSAQEPKWHREDHRRAVPLVLPKTLDNGRLVDQCQHCGWVTPEGFTTIDDRKRKLDEHLVDHHGLVSC